MQVRVNDLGFAYDERHPIFQNISFTANPGEITVIIGTNGAGKTTLLKSIAGLYKHKGDVYFDDHVPDRDEITKRLSFLDQNNDCDVELNVFEVTLLGLVQTLGFRTSDSDIKRVEEILDLVGVRHLSGRMIGEVSGGQRQLIFIAQALVKNPEVMLLDEPTSALDLFHQMRLMSFVQQLTRENGCVTIMTLHHIDMALKYADKVIVLDNGTIYAEGPPSEVLNEETLEEVYNVRSRFITDDEGRRYMLVDEPILDGYRGADPVPPETP